MESKVVIEVAVLVCEQGHRWSDAAKRFANQHLKQNIASNLSLESQLLFQILPVDATVVAAALGCYRDAVVVWEVNAKNVDRRLSNVVHLHRHAANRLQWLAVDDPSRKLSQALPHFMSFAISGILTQPMQMQTVFKLTTAQVARNARLNTPV
ncbi:MAG: hypothetical protein CBB71_14255 [Rhodopirellula sp. TMED11]|nr:MAG: hypothetical protein CBB71_14255 [Rhodopirellula sp. TMED11]